MRYTPVSSAYDNSVPLTNCGGVVMKVLTVVARLILVMSRSTQGLVPRSATIAKHLLEGGGHGLVAGVGLAFGEAVADGEGEAVGDGALETTGVEPQAAVIRAVAARARIQLALFMSCSGNGPAGD
jgi:hypothetical protein